MKQSLQSGDVAALRAEIEDAIAGNATETHASSYQVQGSLLGLILVAVVILCTAIVPAAQPRKGPRKNNGEKLITALVGSEDVAGVFGDDGMYTFSQAPEVQRILKLGPGAIPLLIAHLDDQRLLHIDTIYPDDYGGRYGVTVGAACFDLLTLIIRLDSRFFDQKCLQGLDEGRLSSCSRKGYRVLPEDFWQRKTLRVHSGVLRAKQNWANAYQKHHIRYKALD
jgi:hypothetical protein